MDGRMAGQERPVPRRGHVTVGLQRGQRCGGRHPQACSGVRPRPRRHQLAADALRRRLLAAHLCAGGRRAEDAGGGAAPRAAPRGERIPADARARLARRRGRGSRTFRLARRAVQQPRAHGNLGPAPRAASTADRRPIRGRRRYGHGEERRRPLSNPLGRLDEHDVQREAATVLALDWQLVAAAGDTRLRTHARGQDSVRERARGIDVRFVHASQTGKPR
mmetsp:Transcript_25335/g.67911  ORF Transcript_25335/g.67911 Transcript_25335/m.67911 type:complete len:220 (+) Transcript_25335:699-1358(+)